jgi:hypothetical protein
MMMILSRVFRTLYLYNLNNFCGQSQNIVTDAVNSFFIYNIYPPGK